MGSLHSCLHCPFANSLCQAKVEDIKKKRPPQQKFWMGVELGKAWPGCVLIVFHNITSGILNPSFTFCNHQDTFVAGDCSEIPSINPGKGRNVILPLINLRSFGVVPCLSC